MNLANKVLERLNGLRYRQEYLCLSMESFPQPLHIYLAGGQLIISDITDSQLLIGYDPVIIGIASLDTDVSHVQDLKIIFSRDTLRAPDTFSNRRIVATLELKKIIDKGNEPIVYFEAVRGEHRMIPVFQQFILRLQNRLFNKRPGNIYMPGNRLSQLQIGYAFPRIISLITVSKDSLFNLFPSDLNGKAGKNHYVISLRHAGHACRQVEEAGRIVISQMEAAAFKTVYGLGKNHMQQLKPKTGFPFGPGQSETLDLPIPESAVSYYELTLENTYIHGIHKLMLFKILSYKALVPVPATLAHIHNCYATWLDNNQLEGNYLLR
jgi:hypothetical protein